MTLAPSLTRTSRAQRSRSGSERSTHSALWAGPPRIRKTAMWCRCPRTLAPYSPTPRSARAFGRFARWRRYESTPTSSSRTRSSSIWTRARLETNSTLRSSAGFSGLSAVLCTSLSGCASRAARRDVPTTCVTNPKRTQFSSSLVSEDTRFGVSSGALTQLNVLSQRRSAVRYDRARRGSRCRDCGSLRSVHARFDLRIERAAVGVVALGGVDRSRAGSDRGGGQVNAPCRAAVGWRTFGSAGCSIVWRDPRYCERLGYGPSRQRSIQRRSLLAAYAGHSCLHRLRACRRERRVVDRRS